MGDGVGDLGDPDGGGDGVGHFDAVASVSVPSRLPKTIPSLSAECTGSR